MNDIFDVQLTEKAYKDLKKVPSYIVIKLEAWVEEVGHYGLSSVRKIPGYHDEILKGKRQGQYSIRLNKQYRAIYEIQENNQVHFIEIVEINKHIY